MTQQLNSRNELMDAHYDIVTFLGEIEHSHPHVFATISDGIAELHKQGKSVIECRDYMNAQLQELIHE